MTEIKPYIQGQEIEPVEETRVYVHKDVLKYLELYQEIGTIPQLRALKEDRDKCFLEIQQYRAIETVEEFKELKEKNEPKKPIKRTRFNLTVFNCPTCNAGLYSYQRFCDECGQSILNDYD